MSEQYARELLRVSIAQICQTIGYNSIQTTPLELLQDNLHKFLHEFCRDLKRHVDHYNRTEANLNDVCLTLSNLNINVNELLEYIFNVQPVSFAIDVPKFPLHKESNLNFLKPGSKEVLVRPVHIFAHLPPILPPDEAVADVETLEVKDELSTLPSSNEGNATNCTPLTRKDEAKPELSDILILERDNASVLLKSKPNVRLLDDQGQPTREIGSVMMTTGGFISPAIEGKLPESRVPALIDLLAGLDAPPPPAPPPPPPPPPQPTSLSIPAEKLSNRTSFGATMGSPALSSVAKAEREEKKSGIFEFESDNSVAVLENIDAAKQHGLISFTSDSSKISSIPNTTGFRSAKKHDFSQHSILAPPIAARILKKAKKKSNMTVSAHAKSGRSVFPSTSMDVNITSEILNDKTQRKRMKMLQKIVKSSKSSNTETSSASVKKVKNLPVPYNPVTLSSLPPGADRMQLEKILKKQAKHRQKLKRQQLAMVGSDKSVGVTEQFLQIPNELNANSAFLLNEIGSLKHSHSQQTQFLSKTNANATNISGMNISPPKTPKQTPPLSALGAIQGNKSIKTNVASIPMFGESPYVINEQIKDFPENKTPETKLSTEPDRNKLNIFKKISSKQKPNRGLSPLQTANQVYACNDNQVISLPAGTTITPAALVSGGHVYAPEDNSFITTANKKGFDADTNIMYKYPAIGEQVQSLDLVNKPKKRGRKPGSKNQPKIPGTNFLPGATNLRKPKKLKLQKNIFGPQIPLAMDQTLEPLNLSHSIPSGSSIGQNFPLGIPSTFPMFDSKAFQLDIKERKERKKPKLKCAPSLFSEPITLPNLCIQQSQREPFQKPSDLLSSGPTKEEVDSINRKLMRMDTVLQPAPPLHPISMTAHNNRLLASKDISPSVTKSSNPINVPGPKNRSVQQQRNSEGSLSTASLDGQLGHSMQNFSNLTPNMLSMLPLYAFPPRPGLIPTPGLFPPVLGSFPNNSSNPASNMMLQSFLPFPGLNPGNNGPLRGSGSKSAETSEPSVVLDPPKGERSYCNVAPLVPDSVQLKLSSSPGFGKASLASPNVASFRDAPKTPQMRQSPTVSETVRESLQQKLGGMATPESGSIGSKSIPPTPGGISLNTYENIRSGISSATTTPSSSTGTSDTLMHSNVPNRLEKLKKVSSGAIVDTGSPIELSDDSQEAGPSFAPISPAIQKIKSSLPLQPITKSSALAPPAIGQDDIFIPIENATESNKDTRKLKKLNKLARKNTGTSSTAIPLSASLSGIGVGGNESCESKLTGDAESISLWDARLSYSQKTAPTNILAAMVGASSFESTRKKCGAVDTLTNLSVSSASPLELQNKRKDHKKLKKIKYGKIKKKKDKKDKTKSKEKCLENIDKHLKEKALGIHHEKESIRKLKKEKKKEKQRSAKNSFASPPLFSSPTILKQSVASSGFDISITNAPKVSAMSSIPSNSSVVPKLTLKLGNCQSPTPTDDAKQKPSNKLISPVSISREPSPELARISPLVTRPPKQKSNLTDNTNHTITSGGMTSSGSSIVGSDTAPDLLRNESSKSNTFLSANVNNTAIPPPPISWSSGGTLTASSTLLPQQLLQTSVSPKMQKESSAAAPSSDAAAPSIRPALSMQNPVSLLPETNRPSSYIDAEGNRVWICPPCGKVDDGSPMIGCDGCDAWYHWVCVGIFVAPNDNEDWFCRECITKKKGSHGVDKKRKRNKKSK